MTLHSFPTDNADRDALREDSRIRRRSRQALGVADLLERRPELRGVSTFSDEVVEAVLWTA
jgi:hypothetical protein